MGEIDRNHGTKVAINSSDAMNHVISPYIDKAAGQLEKVSQFLRATDLNELKNSAEKFARREPLIFLGGTLMLGTFTLLTSLVIGLGTLIPLWVSALVVGVVLGAIQTL